MANHTTAANGALDGRRVALISIDGHVGPRAQDLREYCEQKHLDAYDAFVEAMLPLGQMSTMFFFGVDGGLPPMWQGKQWKDEAAIINRLTTLRDTKGHFDPAARLADITADGIAGEVLFHGSNGEWVPFERSFLAEAIWPGGDLPKPTDEQRAAGLRMYNRWLADFCKAAPNRFCGLAAIPYWDIEASIREMKWAREQGLRGVVFPALQEGIPAFSEPDWDPFYSVCEDLDLPLSTHGGAAPMPGVRLTPSPTSVPIAGSFDQGWFCRRSLWWMICSGVFERHPKLKAVHTEDPGAWWNMTAAEMDGIYLRKSTGLQDLIPKLPSYYMRRNCFLGASFAGRKDVEQMQQEWENNLLWGCDYPHQESTWRYTTLSLNKSFEGMPETTIRKMVGENAAKVYGFDLAALAPIVDSVGPTLTDLSKPFDPKLIPPESETGFAFRDGMFMA